MYKPVALGGYMILKNHLSRIMVGALAVMWALVPSSASAVVIVQVSPGNMAGATADTRGTPDTASVQFVFGPTGQPAGHGSAQLSVGANGDRRARLHTSLYGGTKISDLTTLNNWTYTHSSLTAPNHCNPANAMGGERAPYIVLAVHNPALGDPLPEDFLFFEPTYQGLFSCDKWYSWNALAGNWWSGDPAFAPPGKPLAAYEVAHRGSTIVNNSSSAGGGVRIQAGVGAPDWNGFVGNTDAFSIGVRGGVTTYDFEPVTCQEADGGGDFQ